MYVPSFNRIDDPAEILGAMRQNPFATLISVQDAVPLATHLPLLIEDGDPIYLCGHIARQNGQWKSWGHDNRVLVIFAGPHAYVSPRYYESRPNVPTWNYVAVHAYGALEVIESEESAIEHLEKLVATFDPNLREEQPESMDREFFKKLLPGIVVFKIRVESVDAKAKLSQNKSAADREGVRALYAASEVVDERAMAEMMRRQP